MLKSFKKMLGAKRRTQQNTGQVSLVGLHLQYKCASKRANARGAEFFFVGQPTQRHARFCLRCRTSRDFFPEIFGHGFRFIVIVADKISML